MQHSVIFRIPHTFKCTCSPHPPRSTYSAVMVSWNMKVRTCPLLVLVSTARFSSHSLLPPVHLAGSTRTIRQEIGPTCASSCASVCCYVVLKVARVLGNIMVARRGKAEPTMHKPQQDGQTDTITLR